MPPYLTSWSQIPITLNQLCLTTVLRCGQSFCWKASAPDEWSCGFPDRIISLKQSPSHLLYRAQYLHAPPAVDDTEHIVRDYLNLNVDLETLYEKWAKADGNFKKKAGEFRGVRMLRQDPWDCLVGFICSSNNNIARISQMVDKLCSNYGTPLGHLPPTSDTAADIILDRTNTVYFSFPRPSALTDPTVESKLRQLGFGYRAKYIAQTALLVADKPEQFLDDLRNKSTYREAHDALLEMSGVGPKVADCVCLMSLDKMEAVPVDTHVWQIALRDYKFSSRGKFRSLTKATYDAVGDHFRALWGEEAGWAHSVLFTADLRAFAERLEATKKVKVEIVQNVKVEPEEEEDDVGMVVKKEEDDVGMVVKKENVDIKIVQKETVVRKRGVNGKVKRETTLTEESGERRLKRKRR